MKMKMKMKIYKEASKIAKTQGLENLTQKNVCDAAGIPPGSWLQASDGETFTQFAIRVAKKTGARVSKGSKSSRMNPEFRSLQIIDSAMRIAESKGPLSVSVERVCKDIGVSRGTVSRLFKTKELVALVLSNLSAKKTKNQ